MRNIESYAIIKIVLDSFFVSYTKGEASAKERTVSFQHGIMLKSGDALKNTLILCQRHASLRTMMDRYVHITDDSLANAIRQFEKATPAAYEKRA